MDEVKFTPGNWSVVNRMTCGEGWAIISDHRFRGGNNTTHQRFVAQFLTPEDAQLFSAAKDLHAALKWFIDDIDGTHTVMLEFDANVERARAALSKARGQS